MECKNNMISSPVIVGESLAISCTIYDGATAKDLSGYTASGRIGKRNDNALVAVVGTVEDQITYPGKVSWFFTAAQTGSITAGAYVLELELTDGTNTHKHQEIIQVYGEVENVST